MNIRSTLRGYVRDAARAFDRAPTEVGLALLTAGSLSYGIEHAEAGADVAHVVIANVLLIFTAWSATLMHALGGIARRTRWLITGGGAGAVIVYLLATEPPSHEGEAWRALMLIVAAVLLAVSAPALPALPDDANLRLRRVNGRFFVRVAGIALYGLALFGGLALALAAIDNLFQLNLDEEIYGHVFVWIMAVLVPWVVAGGLDDYVRPLEETSEITSMVHRLIAYLVPLLVAIYFLILYAYTVRIAVTGELPRNLVSPMVIAAGALSLLSIVLFDPAPAGGQWRWLRWTPIAYLPLVPLGFWALSQRFQDYGWTEFRALRIIVLIVLAALAAVMTLRVVRRRDFPLRLIPIVLGVALLLSAVGPWSVLAVSRRDQQARLAEALRQADVNVELAPNPADTTAREIAPELYARIASGSRYLSSHFGGAAVRAVVPTHEATDRFADVAGHYRLVPAVSDTATQTYAARLGTRSALGDGVAYRIRVPQKPEAGGAHATFQRDSLFVTAGTEIFRVDMQAVMTSSSVRRREAPPADLDALPVLDAAGVRRGDLLVLDLTLIQEHGARRLAHLDAILIVR